MLIRASLDDNDVFLRFYYSGCIGSQWWKGLDGALSLKMVPETMDDRFSSEETHIWVLK